MSEDVTLKQLDKEEKIMKDKIKRARAKYDKLFSEYIKTCEHPRKTTSYDDWDKLYNVRCSICSKHITTYR